MSEFMQIEAEEASSSEDEEASNHEDDNMSLKKSGKKAKKKSKHQFDSDEEEGWSSVDLYCLVDCCVILSSDYNNVLVIFGLRRLRQTDAYV